MRWLLGTVSILALAAGSSACLFPDYSFDEPEPTGGSGPGTTTTTTSSVGGGGAGGEGGSGGAPPVEDCFAPGDEDGDALADCADPDCDADLECAPSFPVGWNNLGYVALFRGDAGINPACPAGTTGNAVYEGNAALQNTAASCSPCTCGAPQDRDCFITQDFNAGEAGLQGAQVLNVSNCGAASRIDETTMPSNWDGICHTNETFPGGQSCSGVACNQSVRVGTATVSGGSCASAGGQPSGASPTWAERGEACRATAGLTGCSAGSSCVLKPKAPWGSRVCIARAGDWSCPSESLFTQKRVFYGDYADDRSCTGCDCNSPTGGTCKLTVSFYADAVCGGTPVAEIESGACGNLSGNPTIASWEAAVTTPPAGGSCNAVAGGGQPSGTVTPTEPTTFCCLP